MGGLMLMDPSPRILVKVNLYSPSLVKFSSHDISVGFGEFWEKIGIQGGE